ncbi:MAG: VWA domain-containing protein [Chloroflexi bacterium]|nr:VWA domain-containing protein [Chloroflexota bacterium]
MVRVISLLRERLGRAAGFSDNRQSGQILIIVAIGVFVLLILVGLAVDLGLYFIERVRISRAVDAATLAAAYELPFEGAAQLQALDYLRQNGYDFQLPETAVYIDGVLDVGASSGITKTAIYLDMAEFRDRVDCNIPDENDGDCATISETAYRIQVRVTQVVPVIFLRFAGFDNLQCAATSVAENINNLDVVIIFDRSGSMEFNTICYGCWEKETGVDYPDGNFYPLPWDGPADWDPGDPNPPERCEQPSEYVSSGGYDYYFIEAEEYSYNSNPYSKEIQRFGYTYWVLQRTGRHSKRTYASGRDSRADGGYGGAYIMHMPYPDKEESGPGATCRYEQLFVDVSVPPDGTADFTCWDGAPGGPYPTPRVDYNFAPVEDRSGGYYIWVRGQTMSTWDRGDDLDQRLFWGIDGVVGGSEGRQGDCGVGCETGFDRGNSYGGAGDDWEWQLLNRNGPIYWTQGVNRTLNIWAGGAAFALDRIVITTRSSSSIGNHAPIQANSGRGTQEWANGRTGWACNRCDARFAGYPQRENELGSPSDVVSYFPICNDPSLTEDKQDRRSDEIYDDEQPVRGSVEAAKMFSGSLIDPKFDQVGYVSYSSNASIDTHLQCVRRLGEACDATVITDTVLYELDITTAGGGTNIAEGMELGLEVLQTGARSACEAGTGPCGRPGANHVMIVMTDGRANQTPNDYCDDDPERQWPGGSAAQDCVIYYAYEARDSNVIVYTITLGGSADIELMEEVANITGGVYKPADNPGELDKIFEDLYDLMFLRLVK